jgi:hypothetical protein
VTPLHHRTVIRRAAVRALIDANTCAGDRVFDHPWNERDTLPAITLEDLGEFQEAPDYGFERARTIQRRLTLQVSGEVEALDDWAAVRDDLMAQIEAAMAGLQVVGVKQVVPVGYSPDGPNNGARPTLVGRQRFEVTYLTPMNNPAAVL